MSLGFFRRWAWRLGRKLYCWARRDLENDPETNGEYWLLRELAGVISGPALLFDVGANKGDWSVRAHSLTRRAGQQVAIAAFEPCAATRRLLAERVASMPGIEVLGFALSSSGGEADFFSSGAGAGTNSLYSESGPSAERVQLITLDRFVEQRGIDRIDMVKVDTEGHDFEVLTGARRMLAKGWDFKLDRLFENSYVLVRKGSALERLGQAVAFDCSNCVQASRALGPG